MSMVEAREQIDSMLPIKIFATDVHSDALAIAREGLYTEKEIQGVNPEQLGRFFSREADGWRIRPELRGMVAFSNHNILTDAPFTRIDLLSCRNTLIYFSQSAQRSALWAFGFALRTGGAIMVGESESLGPATPDFEQVAPSLFRMHSNRATSRLRRVRRVGDIALRPRLTSSQEPQTAASWSGPTRLAEDHLAAERLLEAQGLGGLVVDDSNRLVQVLGSAITWLEIPRGRPPTDATRLVRDVALRTAISSVLRRLDTEGDGQIVETISVDLGAGPELMTVQAQRFGEPSDGLALVSGRAASKGEVELASTPTDDDEASGAAARLRRELTSARAQLDATRVQLEEAIQQQEMAQQELTAANEELLVSNEELQTSIEELSSTNEELRTLADENELRLRDVLDLSADLEHVLGATDIGIVLLNADRTIRRSSGRCDTYFRIGQADVGRPFDDIRANFDDGELRSAVTAAGEEGTVSRLRVATTDEFPFTLQVRVSPYVLANTERGVSVSLVDVSDAQARERELDRLHDRLTSTLEDMSVMMLERSLDGGGMWLSDNAEQVSGLTMDMWRDFPNSSGLDEDEIAQLRTFRRTIDGLVPGAPPSEFDFHRVNPAGGYRTINFKVRVVDRDGQPTLRGLAMDVTTDRERSSRLQRLNDDMVDFTHMASHDLRAPLRTIKGLVELIQTEHDSSINAGVATELDQIVAKVDAMDHLITDLLDYARSGSEHTAPEETHLPTLVAEVAELIGPPEGIEVVVDADVERFPTERVALATCVRNLVENAVKYHPGPPGKITVRAQRTADTVVVTVADDGAGIDPAHHDDVFRPFRRLRGDVPGSGMGLATVKRIVTDRGGSLHLQSEVGRGSAFTINWPVADDRPAPVTAGSGTAGNGDGSGPT